jgi:tRNA threonylcarbamoyladenosine biosynthesis protein TsaE
MVLIEHPPILETQSVPWSDEAACAAFAARLAAATSLWPSTFIALDGPLGAGKTTFARHLLRALGVRGHVKSPTYALLEPYEVRAEGGRFAVSHFDFYRFDDPREWEDAGFREIFANPGLKLVEWPEKAAEFLPPFDLRIAIEPRDDASRDIRLDAATARGAELLS